MKRAIKRAVRNMGEAMRAKHIAIAGLQALNPTVQEAPQVHVDRPNMEIQQELLESQKREQSGERTMSPHEGDPPEGAAQDRVDLGNGVSYSIKDGVPTVVVPGKPEDSKG